jgi:ABC-type dipeptide/oligopeptide/nickel transport system ATPase subunit
MAQPLIEVSDLTTIFGTGASAFEAAKDISFAVEKGSCFGLVGESGSGKSTVLRAISGLNKTWTGRITFDGEDLAPRRSLGFHRRLQMVFQDPYGSLHPRQTVDRQLSEPLDIHGITGGQARIGKVLDQVGLGASFRYRYPHQLSGGQRQRVAIARALILEPEVILLDEPTSALDVSVQAEILNLLMELRRVSNLTYILVSHDLAVVATLCDRLAVMKQGRLIDAMDVGEMRARGGATLAPWLT